MGERPDEIRRGPLGGPDRTPDPIPGEPGFDPATEAFDPDAIRRDPLEDPARGSEETTSAIAPDPALGGGVGGGAVIEEPDPTRIEIERTRTEIERTRADMSETVDAIQDRLSPENLKEQAKDRVKEATVGRAQDAGSGIVGTIRQNPVPAALTGIGLGWLLVSARSQSAEQARLYRRPYSPSGYPPPYDYPPRYEESGSSSASPGEALGRARDRVGETATQAQDKAGEIAGRAQERASELGDQARQTGFNVMDSIRENPVPAALAGVSLGWLLMSGRQSSSGQPRYSDRAYAYDYPSGYEERGSGGPSTGQALDRTRERVGETASQAQDRASQLGDQARYQAERASGGFQRVLREHPLTVGALAAGLGAAVGLAIPETTKEHEVMGETRDNLVGKAQEKAQDAQQKVQRVAEEAQSAAKEEADNQGLTNQ